VDKAKLNKNELYPIVQTVYLGKSLAADDLKLMEIDEDKLNYLLEGNRSGQAFSIKTTRVVTPNYKIKNVQFHIDSVRCNKIL
jgi:hypothetical protein